MDNRFNQLEGNLLEALPKEIITDEIGSNLDKQAISRLRQTSKRMHTLFQGPSDVAKLLHFVKEANYEEAEKLVIANPELMFKYISNISPLKFAFKVLDTYMWKMFLESITGCQNIQVHTALPNDLEKYKTSHILVSSQLYSVNADGKAEIAQIKHPEYMKRFTKQLHEQREAIDLGPLFAEYDTCNQQYNLWYYYKIDQMRTAFEPEYKSPLEDQISDQAVDQAWLNVGKKQREVLPRHMLREFCRKDISWDRRLKFDVNVDPRPLDVVIYNLNTGRDEVVLPFMPNSGLGFDFSLVRGSESLMLLACDGPSSWLTDHQGGDMREKARDGRRVDLKVFRALFEVRINDLDKLRSQLAPFLETTNNEQVSIKRKSLENTNNEPVPKKRKSL